MPINPLEDQEILNKLLSQAVPITLNITQEQQDQAKLDTEQYLSGKISDIKELSNFSIYYLLTILPAAEQIKIIRENIDYLKAHDKDIFLYRMEAPKELAYYFSYEVLKNISIIDEELFKKIMNSSVENVFEGFRHEDYLSYFKEFRKLLMVTDSFRIFNILYKHATIWTKSKDLSAALEKQKSYNKELLNYFMENYQEKIAEFTPEQALSFLPYIKNAADYQKFITENRVKIKIALENINEDDLREYLSENTTSWQQEILFAEFLETISLNVDLKKIVKDISSSVIFKIYQNDKAFFKNMTLFDWLALCSEKREFNAQYQSILDDYKIENIHTLFKKEFYQSSTTKRNISALKYIENKYRNTLGDNKLIPISEISSIFSTAYFSNLNYLKTKLINKSLAKDSNEYSENLAKFILYLKENGIVSELIASNLTEINKLFYRIVMGLELANIFTLSSIEELTILNRIGNIEFKVDCFSIDQLERYNVKHHRKLCQLFKKNTFSSFEQKKLTLKLLLLVGYHHAKEILELDNNLSVLEHLVGNVFVKNITLDEQGNPILNKKLVNWLFVKNEDSKIKELLENQNSELYQYFPRLFNEWEMIEMYGKDKTLKSSLDFLKSDNISLAPNYYRLKGLFKYIGCRDDIVKETFSLHDQMIERTESTIPRVTGSLNDYSYEVLRLDDLEGLAVGNKTNCCFTVLGEGYSCLKHAATSKNGRILVVRKDDEILAHSWLWRNGDLLCLDNIETSKSIKQVDFFKVYLQFADAIIEKSFTTEGANTCLKNITLGYTDFDKKINGLETFPCLIAKNLNLSNKFANKLGSNRFFVSNLPQPLEKVAYSDSKKVQYLLKGTGKFNLGQSEASYLDERKPILHYNSSVIYDSTYIQQFNDIINALRYLKSEKEGKLSSYKIIDVQDLFEAHCNVDWYSITSKDGSYEEYICDLEKPEINAELTKKNNALIYKKKKKES